DALNQFIDADDGMNAIYSFLRRRDLSAFNPYRRPPMTEAKREVIAVSGHPLRAHIVDAVESGHFRRELGADTLNLDALQRLLHRDGYGQHAKNHKELGEALAMAGVQKVRPTIRGSKRRCHRLPPSEGKPESLSEPEEEF